jgi:mitochondrial fission protein ELM1
MEKINERGPEIERIVLVGDGIRGHWHQILGIGRWLQRLCGATLVEVEAPRLEGLGRFLSLKVAAKHLRTAHAEEAQAWLIASAGKELLDRFEGQKGLLFLAAGSSAAPYGLALARATGGRAAVVMTPSVLGTAPFDFAIVPSHDYPYPSERICITTGAPNHIYRPDLGGPAEDLARSNPPRSERIVALLVGGSDGNYRIDADWVRRHLGPVREQAERLGAALYVTTSRRTGKEADSAVEALLGDSPSLRMLLLASRDGANPVPALLGLATHVLVTDDSVSMVSEAATAGFRVGLLRARRLAGPKAAGQRLLTRMAAKKLLSPSWCSGPPRFDALFAELEARGCLADVTAPENLEVFLAAPDQRTEPLDEARRAAQWILERWKG